LIVFPEPAEAPVILPLIVPIVHEKLLAMEAVNEIFGFDPLQVLAAAGLVTVGFGLTLTVIVYGAPAHEPALAVGVTR
jgi:hypothetical protein